GLQQIELSDVASHEVSDITPFSPHPQYVANDDVLPAYLEYQIPVRGPSESDTLSVSIPYRSTSKQLAAHWVGEIKGTIFVPAGEPIPKLVDSQEGYIRGTLMNHTGYDLADAYLAFKRPPAPYSRDEDCLIYLPQWPHDAQIKLEDLITTRNSVNPTDRNWRLSEDT